MTANMGDKTNAANAFMKIPREIIFDIHLLASCYQDGKPSALPLVSRRLRWLRPYSNSQAMKLVGHHEMIGQGLKNMISQHQPASTAGGTVSIITESPEVYEFRRSEFDDLGDDLTFQPDWVVSADAPEGVPRRFPLILSHAWEHTYLRDGDGHAKSFRD